MKHQIRINIGLLTNAEDGCKPIDSAFVAEALRLHGFTREHVHIAHSTSEDGPEPVLVWAGYYNGGFHHLNAVVDILRQFARGLKQDCIALRYSTPEITADMLVGPAPYAAFDPALFIEP